MSWTSVALVIRRSEDTSALSDAVAVCAEQFLAQDNSTMTVSPFNSSLSNENCVATASYDSRVQFSIEHIVAQRGSEVQIIDIPFVPFPTSGNQKP